MNSKHRRLFQQNNCNAAEFHGRKTRVADALPNNNANVGKGICRLLSAVNLQNLDGVRKKAKLTALQITLLLFPVLLPAETSVQQQARMTIEQSLSNNFLDIPAADWSFQTEIPDALFHCELGYQVQWRDLPRPGANTAKLSCPQSTLQAYISVRIALYKTVIVSSRPLTRGQPITVADLTSKRADISTLRHGYFQQRQQIAGWQLARTVKAGQVLTPYLVKAPLAVRRGDWVRIETGSDKLRVSMMGEALKDGAIGQQIPVKNLRSNKRIKAWIIGKGLVSTRKGSS